MTSQQQSVLPAEAWYHSPVQVAAVIAAASQLASIVIRWFGLPITDEQIETYSADALQFVTIASSVWAIVKRQTSAVAPLTLTAGGAARQTTANPPLLDADPTKTQEPKS